MSILGTGQTDLKSLLDECMDPDKVVLHCGQHGYTYRNKRTGKYNKLNFAFPKCQFVAFFSLLANTPAGKRQETVEMLEYSIHKLIEAEKRGELNSMVLNKSPEVNIEKG